MLFKLQIIKFWIIAFSVLMYHTLKKSNWHMIYADFHCGDKEDGWPKRKRLIAMKTANSLNLQWQDMDEIWDYMKTGDSNAA